MPQIVDQDIERYASEHSTAEPPELQAVAAETHEKFGVMAGMLTGHLEGGSFVARQMTTKCPSKYTSTPNNTA